jgi:signal peptidase II
VTGSGSAGGAAADDRTDDVDIVEDEAGSATTGEAPAAAASDAWRGPSLGRWIAFAAIAIGVLVVDQASKAWVTGTLDVGEGIELIGEWLRVVHGATPARCSGCCRSPRRSLPWCRWSSWRSSCSTTGGPGRGLPHDVALALLLGGAIGNLLDRLRYGSVVDFVDMGVGQWRFYTTTPPTPRSRRRSCC